MMKRITTESIIAYLEPLIKNLDYSEIFWFGSTTYKDMEDCNDFDIVITVDGDLDEFENNILRIKNLPFEIEIEKTSYINKPPPRVSSEPSTNLPVHLILMRSKEFEYSEIRIRNKSQIRKLEAA